MERYRAVTCEKVVLFLRTLVRGSKVQFSRSLSSVAEKDGGVTFPISPEVILLFWLCLLDSQDERFPPRGSTTLALFFEAEKESFFRPPFAVDGFLSLLLIVGCDSIKSMAEYKLSRSFSSIFVDKLLFHLLRATREIRRVVSFSATDDVFS